MRDVERSDLDDHRDRRGWVVNPFDHIADTGEVSNCHAFSIEPGCSRGGHSHPGRNEQLLVLAGSLEVDVEGKLHTLDTERLRILTIPGGLAHTLRNRGEATAVAVCWSSGREGDYQGPDTIRG